MGNLVLRIRADTLQHHLEKAHSNLQQLPDAYQGVQQLRQELGAAIELALDGFAIAQAGNTRPADNNATMRILRNKFTDISDATTDIRNNLDAFRKHSFIARIGPVAQQNHQSLQGRADDLRERLGRIMNRIARPGAEAEAWCGLAQTQVEARDVVFSSSIELLGGIALRDAGLDAQICELAEALIALLSRGASPKLHAIPGGITRLMMSLEQVISLPYPQWTVWYLPVVAQGYCHVALRESLKARQTIAQERARLMPFLGEAGTDLCLTDVYATYTMGPAYAYVALTLLLDPLRKEDDLRAHTVLCTLEQMNPGPEEGMDTDYITVANELRGEWQDARHQALVALARNKEAGAARIDALGEYNPAPASPAGIAYHAVLDALKELWQEAATTPDPVPLDTPGIDGLDTFVRAVVAALKNWGTPSFSFEKWPTTVSWADRLRDETVDQIDPQDRDLRHVLNAAWHARVDVGRRRLRDSFTEDVLKLARRVGEAASQELRRPGAPEP